MASKSVLELAVGTGQWDSGLKKAKQALDNFTQANGGLQQALNKDSASMQQFVKMMGQMDSTAKTAKGQMNDYKAVIEQLTMQYNRMTDAQKSAVGQDYLRSIDQMKQKYQAVAEEVQKINQSLKQSPSGGDGGQSNGLLNMMQVFGGNMMTKAAEYVAGLGGEVVEMMNASAELAKSAEGVYVAFQRLGRPGLLDDLKEATHGTVSEFELMKAAVQFNDFKLPLQELGTMLAFAQQKAKDTGQSVDYMVQSIVTGLGRKSLMILDNLGLSAAQVKDKMKDTGDMTKAVGEIIREQMAKAGEYVDTASDKASRANAKLQDEMLELGRVMQDVFGYTGWSDMAAGIKSELVGAITFTIETIGRAKDAWNGLMQAMGIKNKPQKTRDSSDTAPRPNGTYVEQTDSDGNIRSGYWYNGKIAWNSAGVEVVGTKREKKKITKTGSTPKVPTISDNANLWAKMLNTADNLKNVDTMPSVWDMIGETGRKQIIGTNKKSFDLGKDITEKDLKKLLGISNTEGKTKSVSEEMNKITQSVTGIFSGIEQLGVELPQGLKDVLGGIQTVAGILTAISSLVTIITALQGTKSMPVIGWMLSGGGVIHAADGYQVPGNYMSGDKVPAMLNSGELVLNKAQQGVLASSLQAIGQGGDGGGARPYVNGEMIWLGLTNYLNRSGRGEIMTSRRK